MYEKGPYAIWQHQKPRSACPLMQYDQGLCCSLAESLHFVDYVYKCQFFLSFFLSFFFFFFFFLNVKCSPFWFTPWNRQKKSDKQQIYNSNNILGSVVQSIISLTSSLVVKILTVLVSTISNSHVFLLKKNVHFFSKYIFFQQKY